MRSSWFLMIIKIKFIVLFKLIPNDNQNAISKSWMFDELMMRMTTYEVWGNLSIGISSCWHPSLEVFPVGREIAACKCFEIVVVVARINNRISKHNHCWNTCIPWQLDSRSCCLCNINNITQEKHEKYINIRNKYAYRVWWALSLPDPLRTAHS